MTIHEVFNIIANAMTMTMFYGVAAYSTRWEYAMMLGWDVVNVDTFGLEITGGGRSWRTREEDILCSGLTFEKNVLGF